jgi:hypothetical protein
VSFLDWPLQHLPFCSASFEDIHPDFHLLLANFHSAFISSWPASIFSWLAFIFLLRHPFLAKWCIYFLQWPQNFRFWSQSQPSFLLRVSVSYTLVFTSDFICSWFVFNSSMAATRGSKSAMLIGHLVSYPTSQSS